jgi:hypothetical protein
VPEFLFAELFPLLISAMVFPIYFDLFRVKLLDFQEIRQQIKERFSMRKLAFNKSHSESNLIFGKKLSIELPKREQERVYEPFFNFIW